MVEMLKEALIITAFMVFVIVVGASLFFLIGLAIDTGSIILTILAGIIAMFVFVLSILAALHFIEE